VCLDPARQHNPEWGTPLSLAWDRRPGAGPVRLVAFTANPSASDDSDSWKSIEMQVSFRLIVPITSMQASFRLIVPITSIT
jgi:hypothetical protein